MTQKSGSKEVAARDHDSFESWVEVMRLQADEIEDNDDWDVREFLGRVTQVSTFEEAVEMLSGAGMKNGKDLVGITHVISSYKLRRSDSKYERGEGVKLGVFAVVTAETLTGEELLYATGAPNILAMLWQAEKFDRLPLKAQIRARETANGELLSLTPIFS